MCKRLQRNGRRMRVMGFHSMIGAAAVCTQHTTAMGPSPCQVIQKLTAGSYEAAPLPPRLRGGCKKNAVCKNQWQERPKRKKKAIRPTRRVAGVHVHPGRGHGSQVSRGAAAACRWSAASSLQEASATAPAA